MINCPSSTSEVPDDLLVPSISSRTNGSSIPDNLVELTLNPAEICMADSGECTMSAGANADAARRIFENTCTHEERFRPAYELVDGSLERAGRASSAAVKVQA